MSEVAVDLPDGYEAASCSVCGASPAESVVDVNPFIRHCNRCGMRYAHPRPVRDRLYGRQSREYWLNEYLPSYAPVDLRQRYATPISYAAPYRRLGRLLDVGCGVGLFLNEAKRVGWQAEGVDVSPYTREYAAEQFGITIHIGELAELGLADGAYDVVTMWDVVEHVQDPGALLSAARRLLRPGGLLMLSTPNWNSLARYILKEWYHAIGPDDHIHYFADRTLSRLVRQVGFEPVHRHTEYFGAQFIAERAHNPVLRFVGRHSILHLPLNVVANRLRLGDQISLYAVKPG